MELAKNTELTYTPDVDTNLQVKGSTKVYFTKDNTQPKSEWQTIRFEDRITIPSGATYYFWCTNDNELAEIGV